MRKKTKVVYRKVGFALYMRYQVPQFIDIEDQVVGPFSLRQFSYVGGAGILVMIFYFTLQTWLWITLSIPITAAGLCLALIKINGQNLPKIVSRAILFLWEPQIYVWKSTQEIKIGGNKEGTTNRGVDVEKIVSGIALHKAWATVQTGYKEAEDAPKEEKRENIERYQIFNTVSGAKKAARRVDYH